MVADAYQETLKDWIWHRINTACQAQVNQIGLGTTVRTKKPCRKWSEAENISNSSWRSKATSMPSPWCRPPREGYGWEIAGKGSTLKAWRKKDWKVDLRSMFQGVTHSYTRELDKIELDGQGATLAIGRHSRANIKAQNCSLKWMQAYIFGQNHMEVEAKLKSEDRTKRHMQWASNMAAKRMALELGQKYTDYSINLLKTQNSEPEITREGSSLGIVLCSHLSNCSRVAWNPCY